VLTSGASDLVGRVLAGRYRLRAPIGAGASGRVYVADDIRLRRRVAVKVLHAALADDSGFLRRFRAEAQLAASLHHPNVMAVYDWGEDDLPFMVLELLEGGSLRAMLDRDHKLTPAQAAHVGRQVAAALDYAHVRGLVHRDIKPANLLFDEHGIVRVADFGLARALAEASWTEPAGALLGTARYAAPEQATGSSLGARADLYALALVLVEAVSGKVPFAGDTPVGTLMARTQSGISAPAELGPLAAVVERAGQMDPEDRYPDAATMGSALADAAAALPPPGPLVLSGIHEVGEDPYPTQIGVERQELFDQDRSDDTVVLDHGPQRQAQRRWPGAAVLVPTLLGAFVVIALALAGVAIATASDSGARVAVPNLQGLTRSAAAERAAGAGVGLEIATRAADEPKDYVIQQVPAAGSWMSRGNTVRLVVSTGREPVPMPQMATKSGAEAAMRLTSQGFVVGPTVAQADETVPKDFVIGTDPAAGAPVAPGSTVRLLVSTGPAPRAVPSFPRSVTYEAAAAAINALQLKPVRAEDFSDTVPAGQFIRTSPPARASVPRGATVTVVFSKGPQLVLVPDVRRQKVENGAGLINSLGLVADVQGFKAGKAVKGQSVPPGAQVPRGTHVVLTL
jgi:beta-lactam-binding protein with PASTA domain/tRNA A-37 threonylcarbamoyl transferase component Bud32